MKQLINSSIKNSISYLEYKILMDKMVHSKSTTGHEKTEDLINYTMLNDRRMKRWDKTIQLTPESMNIIKSFQKKVIWLVITESWCGDAAHVIPVINKVAELNSKISLKIVLRDDNPELMDAFLTNGSRSIPKLIAIENDTLNVIHTFGPRPTVATDLVDTFKANHGALTADFKEDLQRWYNKDKGQSTLNDLVGLLRLSSEVKSNCT